MIRRSLRHVEVTADPLSYISVLSDTFFGQVSHFTIVTHCVLI